MRSAKENIISYLVVVLVLIGYSVAIIDGCSGYAHFCEINELNKLRCGGDNTYGQLGYGDYFSRGNHPYDIPLPIVPQVTQNDPYIDVECGSNFTCARTMQGIVSCWGDNSKGQLGAGTTLSNIPLAGTVIMLYGPSMSLCAGNAHVCSVSNTFPYVSQCWGDNSKGQLCTGDNRNRGSKQSDFPLPNITIGTSKIVCGYDHVFAILATNTLRAWGDNRYGQLGYGNTNPPYNLVGIAPGSQPVVPVVKQGLPTVILDVKAGVRHTCILYQQGNVTCVGYNSRGQLGYPNVHNVGNNYDYLPPPQVNVGFIVKTIIAGYEYTCVTGYSTVVQYGMLPNITACWGDNSKGQLGLGTTQFGIGILDGTMPPLAQNTTLSSSIGFIGGPASQSTNYLVLLTSTMRGGNATVAPHLVYRQILTGWGDNSNGQLLTGFQLNNTLIPIALNTECGDSITDLQSGEECDLGIFANGQQCTPFCNMAPCMDSSSNCSACYISTLSPLAEQAGCFLATKPCPGTSPVTTSVCVSGTWNTQSITNNNTLVLSNPLSIIGSYTQEHNGTLILSGNATIIVNGTAYLDGSLVLGSMSNTQKKQIGTNNTIIQANSIQGSFSTVQIQNNTCFDQTTTSNNGIVSLVVTYKQCPVSNIGQDLGGIAGAFVVLFVLVGIILFISYRRNICRPLFHQRESYEVINTNY